MPQLPSKAEYSDINGEECLELLHTRFWDYIHTLPELQRRFALTRLMLRFEITLDIYGATPPKKVYHHQFEVTVTDPQPPHFEEAEAHHETVIDVDSRNNPPDQIREEHGLALPRAIRGQAGILETGHELSDEPVKYVRPRQPTPSPLLPANQSNPNSKQVGRRRYAAFVEQDYGSLQAGDRKGDEGPAVGAEKIAESGSGSGADHAPVQADFRVADYRGIGSTKAAEVVQQTVERGRKVDAELNKRHTGVKK
jgi:hypothetical protein